MSSSTLSVQDCTSLPTGDRCDAALPDNPQCTLNYHFGQLLGVEDFRAEQGFHLGRSRRHQRLLHGHGVVAGYPVSYKPAITELRVGPGYAIDGLGRDLELDTDQCVNLAKWWAARVTAKDGDFNDVIDKTEFTVDLDLVVCYATCLSEPVPAIAEPCAGAASDLAYSRVCETVRLQLVRHQEAKVVVIKAPIGKGKEPIAKEANVTKLASAKALSRIPVTEPLPDTRDALIDHMASESIAPPNDDNPQDLCLTLAQLRGVHIKKDGKTWQVDISDIDVHVRQTLLPTSALQSLLIPSLDTPPPPAGPLLIDVQVKATGDTVTLPFNQRLAEKSVQTGSFTVTQFDAAAGWTTLNVGTATYTEPLDLPPLVTLKLDTALAAGQLTRICVVGFGPTPLLGHNLLPVGASRSDRDGRVLTITIQ
jgi:hypothetical protein